MESNVFYVTPSGGFSWLNMCVSAFHLESAVNVYFVFFVHLTRFTCCHVINQVECPFSISHAHACVLVFVR